MLTPFREACKQALMSWHKMSEEEADKKVRESTFEELDSITGASRSIIYAAKGIAKALGLSEERTQEFVDCVLAKDSVSVKKEHLDIFVEVAVALESANKKEVALQALSEIHDGWVKDYAHKFNQEGRENKRYQHLPIEMIGWEEVKSDLLFLSPVLETVFANIDEKSLENGYNARVQKFFADKKLLDENGGISKSKTTKAILSGSSFYSALSPVNSTQDQEVAQDMFGQVKERVGNIVTKTIG